jgi:membrane protein YdbS with pleckstrin-like domain
MIKRDIFGFGGMKVITDRAATYANRVLTIINLVLLVNLNVLAGADIMQYMWVGLLGLVAFIVLIVFDLVVIYPQEINFRDTRSDVMGEMHRKLDELLKEKEK